MLDIGWTELLVIAVILIVVVGPKDLPPMIRAFGKMTKRLRQTAGEFRAQFDEALREAELDDLKNSVNDIRSLNPANSIRETLNPLRQMGQEIKSDLERSTRGGAKTKLEERAAENSIMPDVPLGLGEPPEELKAASQAPTDVAPATSAPAAASAPVVDKKPASRKAVTKPPTSNEATSKNAKSLPADEKATDVVKPKAPKPVASKAAAAKPVPAEKAALKPASKARKTKSEDRA